MRVKTKALEGEAEVYDGTDPGPFATLAGDRYRDGENGPQVEVAPGVWIPLEPGWAVFAPDGRGRVVISSPDAWDAEAA